ncbi:MAG: iron ABC transporter permease [Nitrospinae bacterium]|nr:iron ABC transporter permease [Nitrospinota bacterium]
MKRITLLIIVSIGILFVSVFTGARFINPFNPDDIDRQILFSIRLPRITVAMLIGSALGASGAVLQGILRNPLADPYILGISSGAALMAAVGIIFGSIVFGLFTVPLLAFIGAVSTGVAVGIMGYKRGGILPERLLLAGIGIGFLLSSVLMLIMSISTDEGLRRATLWIFGDLSIADWSLIPYGFAFIFAGLSLSVWRAKGLNALIMGDEIAHSLGFSPFKERLILFISVCLMTASSVSLGGIVGFIGLLIPHIVRFFAGSDSRFLLPLSALTGGTLLCAADTIGRTAISPMEIPAGVVTAILGAPYFLYLLRKREIMGV